MDTGNPSILYDGNASDGNPFCFFSPQPKQCSWQIRLGTKNSCLGPGFCLLCFCVLKSLCNHLEKKKTKKKRITFNSFLCDGSGSCEAQLQNTNRLNQTSRIINKHKPNCSFLTGAKGRRKQPGCDCPLWRYCSYSTGKTTFGTWGAIVNMQNTATKPLRRPCFMPLKQLTQHDIVFAHTGLSPFVNTEYPLATATRFHLYPSQSDFINPLTLYWSTLLRSCWTQREKLHSNITSYPASHTPPSWWNIWSHWRHGALPSRASWRAMGAWWWC